MSDEAEYKEDLATWAKVLINKLNDAGVGHLICHVTGSGDSPNGEEYELYRTARSADEILAGGGKVEDDAIRESELPHGLLEEVTEFFWQWCEETHYSGWYNNEGGYMDMEIGIKVEQPYVKCELYEYPEPEAVLSASTEYN